LTIVVQGIATVFNKIIPYGGDDFLFLKSGCFDASLKSDSNVSLLLDHDKTQSFSSDKYPLEVHASRDHVAFRLILPDHLVPHSFKDMSDDLNTYVGVSIGLLKTKTETVVIDGYSVTTVLEAKLTECSILSGAPAVDSTYGRIVSLDLCDTLENDYLSGKLELHGRYVALHRKVMAQENGGAIVYRHATSSYDRTADRFQRALEAII
jgi:hypothetical protein